MNSKMKKLVSTLQLSHKEWLQYRKMGIGGSDAGAVCGVNPYVSSMQVFLDKTSAVEEAEDKEAMRQGRDLEQYVAERFCEATGLKVRKEAKVAMEFDNAVSFKVYNKFNPQIPEIFRCEEIKKIFGIKMTEETYLKEIYNIDKLTKNKDKTFLIFCCETLEILHKILNNVKLKKGYTILLYSINEDRKLYVKNVKKDNELLLTMVFDEDTLIFPKR